MQTGEARFVRDTGVERSGGCMPALVASRYAIGAKPIAIGGSAMVFRGTDTENDMAAVAVKVFKIRTMEEQVLREHFNRELKVLSSLRHPNVVELLDWGTDDGEQNPYIVLEWLQPDLFDAAKDGLFPDWASLAPVALDILRGLTAVQDTGTLHRDLKPENILLTAEGVAKVADFGISKLQARFAVPVTFADSGTSIYRPSEDDDGNYSLSRDVFGFGMLVIQVLTPEPLKTHDQARARLSQLDVPTAVKEWLRTAIEEDPTRRPQSAAASLAQMESIQEAWRNSERPRPAFYLRVETKVRQYVEAHSGLVGAAANAAIEADLQDVALQSGGSAYELQALGEVFNYKLLFDKAKGQWVVTNATRLAPSLHGDRRARALRQAVVARFTAPPGLAAAQAAAEDLLLLVRQAAESQQADIQQEQQTALFRIWRAQLDAKREVEDRRGQDVRYSGVRQVGQQLHFTVAEPASDELVGQPRMVRAGEGTAVAGEIEAISDGLIVLGIERGRLDLLRPSGKLEYDTEQARYAIKVQQQALEAVQHGRSVRADLGKLLSDLGRARTPAPVTIPRFLHELDRSKQRAVSLGLGLEDMLAVVGPPGTGKTTFIAEYVAQYLTRNPGHRVLIASQTHIALDNALERIAALMPDHNLLRVGRVDRIGDTVVSLSVDQQLTRWREEVLAASRGFLREYARELGFDVSDADLAGLSQQLQSRTADLHEVRSQIALNRASKTAVSREAQALDAAAPQVYALAERLDQLVRSTASTVQLQLASEQFLTAGLSLAGQLEAGAALAERLTELDVRFTELRQAARERENEQRKVAQSLADGLGLAEISDYEALIEQAKLSDGTSSPELQQLREIYDEWEKRFGRDRSFFAPLLARADVVAATCVGLAGVRGSMDIEFDLCILDEASKATATEALVPMGRARRWVLVGDPAQLPPFLEEEVASTDAARAAGLKRAHLQTTVFDLAIAGLPEDCVVQLSEQFRMVPVIGELVSECFYPGRGLSSAPREASPVVSLAIEAPVTWLDSSPLEHRHETRSGTSFENLTEAIAVRDLLRKVQFIAATRKQAVDVAILTGYSAQREQLIRTITGTDLPNLTWDVFTIDEFQGREADIAILSLTRSNFKKEMGFLRSERRLNVGVSRGRDALVIVGDAAFCRSLPPGAPIRTVLDYIERSADCVVSPLGPAS
jgi:tRNA A-37 threonylcarbamoyl transferase component Bud32/flagellar biosynthesis GTPase FlhF